MILFIEYLKNIFIVIEARIVVTTGSGVTGKGQDRAFWGVLCLHVGGGYIHKYNIKFG